jgi:hypothetical protein
MATLLCINETVEKLAVGTFWTHAGLYKRTSVFAIQINEFDGNNQRIEKEEESQLNINKSIIYQSYAPWDGNYSEIRL